MASGNIFKLLAEIKALKLDYAGAVKYLTDRGVEVVGIIKQGLDNFFKKTKARDVDFGNVVQKIPIDDAGVPFNPNTLKSTVEKRGVENLFDEKLPKVKMGSRMNYEKIAELEDIDVELIRGKTWSEIRGILAAIRDKADGGRVGLQSGGWHPGVGRDKKGYLSDHPSFEGGAGGDNRGIKTIPVKNISIGVNEFNNLIKPGLTDYRKKYTDILKKYSTDEFGKWQNLDPSLITEEEGKILEPYGTSIWADMAKEDPAKFFELYKGKSGSSGVPPRDWQDPDVDRAPLYNWVKDGGRVGFQAGGWADALTGQGLAVYNSMKSAQHTDQTIQDTLTELGYWPIPAATVDTGIQSIVNTQPARGGGGDSNINSWEFSTPKFNQGVVSLKEYGPGGTYEMNPAALGMSFFDQTGPGKVTQASVDAQNKETMKNLRANIDLDPFSNDKYKAQLNKYSDAEFMKTNPELFQSAPEEKNFLGKTWDAFTSAPNKMSSQFEIRPGVVPKGPQELGFMTKDIEGFPGVNRDDIRAMYDKYNQFLGRGSAYKSARVSGQVGKLIDMIPYIGPVKKGAEAILGPQGDKSYGSRWAVDNAGYGQGTQRDQFGTYVGTGLKSTVQERMEKKIARVADTLGKRYDFTKEDLMNLDEKVLKDLSKKSKFYATMVQDYVRKIGLIKQDNILKDRRKEAKKEELKIIQTKQKIDAAAANWGGPGGKTYTGPAFKTEGGQDVRQDWSDPTDFSQYSDADLWADGGRVSRQKGGLATMFTRRR